MTGCPSKRPLARLDIEGPGLKHGCHRPPQEVLFTASDPKIEIDELLEQSLFPEDYQSPCGPNSTTPTNLSCGMATAATAPPWQSARTSS